MYFAVITDHRLKLKESEKSDKYQDFARGLRKMTKTMILIVIGALGLVPKWLVKDLEDLEIREQMETIQATALLRSVIILRVLETWGDLLSLKLKCKLIR